MLDAYFTTTSEAGSPMDEKVISNTFLKQKQPIKRKTQYGFGHEIVPGMGIMEYRTREALILWHCVTFVRNPMSTVERTEETAKKAICVKEKT